MLVVTIWQFPSAYGAEDGRSVARQYQEDMCILKTAGHLHYSRSGSVLEDWSVE